MRSSTLTRGLALVGAGAFLLAVPATAAAQDSGSIDPASLGPAEFPAVMSMNTVGGSLALAGRVIAGKWDVPLLDRIELAGTTNDVARVRAGLARFWGTVPMAQTGKLECLTTA